MAEPRSASAPSTLRPRARLLRTLGPELISSEVVAVLELVKNAYDADATRVLIRFVAPLSRGKGRIEVLDNGNGMALSTVKTIWMEPATRSKRDGLRSERFHRRFLGEKGIGRFASARLAEELEVVTRRAGADKEVFAVFDWRQFDDDDRFLDEVVVLWDERAPTEICPTGSINALWRSRAERPEAVDLTTGTILRMSSLRQDWEAKHFEDLTRGLARLVSPGRLNRASDGDQGFDIELELPPEFAHHSTKISPPPILGHPHYTVVGSVNGDGSFDLAYEALATGTKTSFRGRFLRVRDELGYYRARAVELGDESPTESKPVECGPLDLELRVWDRDELGNVIQKTNSTIKDVRRDLDAIAGINIYRDGFRVLPYGEPQDDWLRLDLRRVQNPTLRLSNNQIFGVVHITADDNPQLHDQSNREGLDENQSLEDLRSIMTWVLGKLETLRYEARPRASARVRRAVGGLFSGFNLKPLTDYIAKQLPRDKKAKQLIEQTEKSLGDQLKEIQIVLARYQRLATLGQLIDHVLHEGRQPIALINIEAEGGLVDTASPELTPDKTKLIHDRFSLIRTEGDVLAIAFRRMEPFGGRRRGRPAQLYLEDVVRDAFAVMANETRRLKVHVSLPNTQTLVRVDPAEVQEVVINLLQNSLYWLEQVPQSKRAITVAVNRKGPDHVDILFSDSGPGVPVAHRELVFEPYFSTKPDGVGLGLSIAGEILTDYYGGSLALLDRGPLRGANFLATLRKRV